MMAQDSKSGCKLTTVEKQLVVAELMQLAELAVNKFLKDIAMMDSNISIWFGLNCQGYYNKEIWETATSIRQYLRPTITSASARRPVRPTPSNLFSWFKKKGDN